MKIKITIVCFFSFFYFNFANAKLVSIATDNSKEVSACIKCGSTSF